MTARPRLSPTLDRLLGGRFVQPFLISLAAFCGTYLIADVFDRFDDLIRYDGFSVVGAEYFLLKLPLIVAQLLPVACLVGVLLGFAMLNRSGELLACQALGISRMKIAAPLIAAAVAISAANFILSETVVPVTTRQARYLYTVALKKHELKGIFANSGIWMRVRDGFLSADSYDTHQLKLRGVTMFRVGTDYTLQVVQQAGTASWDGARWRPTDLSGFELAGDGRVVPSSAGGLFKIEAQPRDFGLLRLDPEEFSLSELNRYIRALRRKGLDPGGYLVDRDLKFAMPLACVIMVALGVVVSLDPVPRRMGLSRSFGLGIAIGFSYWLILGFTSSFGRSGLVPAWVAAWLPNLAFAVVTVSLFMFGEER